MCVCRLPCEFNSPVCMAFEVGNPNAFDSNVMIAAFPQIMDTNIANTFGACNHTTCMYVCMCVVCYVNLSEDEVGVYAEAHCDEEEA